MHRFRHIMVPVDFGGSSLQALEVAVELSRRLDASLTLLHVYDVPSYGYSGADFATFDFLTPIEDAARNELDAALTTLRKRVPGAKGILRRGVPWHEIVAMTAEAKADLVIMGTHGRRGFAHVFMGSQAEKTVRASIVPVMTVREEARAGAGTRGENDVTTT